jgi:hypothetical protein
MRAEGPHDSAPVDAVIGAPLHSPSAAFIGPEQVEQPRPATFGEAEWDEDAARGLRVVLNVALDMAARDRIRGSRTDAARQARANPRGDARVGTRIRCGDPKPGS